MDKDTSVTYNFLFDDGRSLNFQVILDKDTAELKLPKRDSYPSWTELSYYQCECCSLKKEDHPYCPVAKNLTELIKAFKEEISFSEVHVEIETETRTIKKRLPLQRALSSLIGLYMATSGCPIMDRFKPMAAFHLPFSTMEETQYRVLGMYMLGQYFIYKKGETPDWDMVNVQKFYEKVATINANMNKRIATVKVKDASLNAVVILNCFADYVPFAIDTGLMEPIENLYKAYF